MTGCRFIRCYPLALSIVAVFGFFAILAGAPTAAWARKSGIAAAGCDGCHSGGNPPSVTLTASPINPAIGQATTLTITVSATNGPVAGFYLTTDDVNQGTFKAIEPGTAANDSGVTHTTPRTGSGGSTIFKAEWSAAVATGVNFAVYALSANGDGTPRGDAGGEAHMGLATGCTPTTYYIDQDGDGYGTSDPAFPVRMDCTMPQGYSAKTGDCDDFNEKNYPGAPELCDGKDNNCDGKIDESVVNTTYCEDKDGDGHGIVGGATKTDCKPSAGFGDCNGDCNDQDKNVYPGAPEICDGRDNNCDGRIDEGVRVTCGQGWCRRYAEGCTMICTPGTPIKETCNFFDDDCDGNIDNGTDAELCGASGLVCVLGRCLPDDGSSPAPGTGGSGAISGGGGGTTTGGGGSVASGTGATGASGSGGGTAGVGGAGNRAGASGGGCSVGSSSGGGWGAVVALLTGVLLAAATLFPRARRRRPLPARRPPR